MLLWPNNQNILIIHRRYCYHRINGDDERKKIFSFRLSPPFCDIIKLAASEDETGLNHLNSAERGDLQR